MIFTYAAAAIDTMLTPVRSSKSATTLQRDRNNGGAIGIAPSRRKKRRSSGIGSIDDSGSTPKSSPSISPLEQHNINHRPVESASCSDLFMTFTPPSAREKSTRRSDFEHQHYYNDSPLSPSPPRSASREAFSGTLKAMDDFELLKVLAEGFFGTVYKVREKANPLAEPIVMKVPIMRDQRPNLTHKKDKKVADWEVKMLNELASHPNILQFKGLCVAQTSGHWQLNLLVEFCDGGTLQQAILGKSEQQQQPPVPMPWHQIAHIARDISDAMAYMHGKGFFHRDLTSMNVLLKSSTSASTSSGGTCAMPPNAKAVVADFGLATRIPVDASVRLQQVGTTDWKAPEVLSEQFYNEKSDLFSFGIILCQMIAATDADPDKGVFRTKQFGIDFAEFCEQKCPKDVPVELLKCAKMCCRFTPAKRPSFSALLQRISVQIIPSLDDDNNGGDEYNDDNGPFVLVRNGARVNHNNNNASPSSSTTRTTTPTRCCTARSPCRSSTT
uniref:dual-specificity kinase n=1 Tax=Globodera rostochiensis TaxID=31243 RepID=A0A914HDK8_GLORO